MSQFAKYIPLNPIEHENMLRTIIGAHMGSMDGNPTQWVVNAVNEAFQRGFGVGFDAGTMSRQPLPQKPAFSVEMPVAERVDPERKQQRRIEQERKRLDYDGIIDVETKP